MKGRKILSLLLSAAMLISCFTVLVYAEGGIAVYRASDAWYEPAGDADTAVNTYNGHTEWTWERKDSNRDWFDFAQFHADKQAFGMIPPDVIGTDNRVAGKAWTTANGGWNHPAVGEGWMLPYMQTGNPDNAVSKTFTAPMSGTVELSAENGFIYGGSNKPGVTNNRTAFVRITVNNQQIWPENGKELRIPENNGQKYEFGKVKTTIYKGDKLRFEVYNGDNDLQNAKYVYWKPVVTYTDNNEGTVYNSYNSLDANINTNTVSGDEVWSWKNYRADIKDTSFIDFKGVSGTANMFRFLLPENEDGTHNYDFRGTAETELKTNALYSTQTDNTNNTNGYNVMGRYWMGTSVTGNTSLADNSIAKVFTAPKSGTVRISAVDADGKAQIYGKRLATSQTSGATVFIKKVTDGALPSPSDTTEALYKHKFTFTGSITTAEAQAVPTEFSPMTVHLNAGEQLWFIVNAGDTVSGNAKLVHWNPVVSYYSYDPFEISLDKSDVSFKSGEETLTSFEDIVSKDSVSVTADAKLLNPSQITDTETAVMCAVIYDGSGNIAAAGISDTAEFTKSSGQDYTFTIDSIDISQKLENGFIKLFVFDSMRELNPLDAIGNENLYTSSSTVSGENEVYIRGFVSPIYAGEPATAALYGTASGNVTVSDIRYINQTAVGSDGSFEFSVPMTASEAQSCALVSNFDCALYAEDIPVYCSASGTAEGLGTEQSPVTFARAIELTKDGGTIIVDGHVTLTEDFAWQTAEKTITISGKDNNSVLDISAIRDFNINTDAIFENLTIGCAMADESTGDGYNRIWANGNHVIISDSVTTSNVIRTLSGGGVKKSVESVNLEVYGGNYNSIGGGSSSDGGGAVSVNGDCILTVGGNVNNDCNDSNWDSLPRSAVIHGGGYGGAIMGNCILTLKGNSKAKYVYGGQNGLNTAQTTGKITVNVEGGSFMNVFAVLKNTNETTTAELNMTGGKAEALMGAQEAVTGDITINALSGTVTRRIIGGCYNEVEKSSSKDYHVSGSTMVVIGKDLSGLNSSEFSRGIYPGSRTVKTYEDELSTVIFTGGTHDKFGNMLSDTYHNDINLSKSKYDYLVKATADGEIGVTDNTNITVTPDSGYKVRINGAEFDGTAYALSKGITDIEFVSETAPTASPTASPTATPATSPSASPSASPTTTPTASPSATPTSSPDTSPAPELPIGILSVDYEAKDKETTLMVEYDVDTEDASVIIAALYDKDNKLISVVFRDTDMNEGIMKLVLPNNIDDGNDYRMRVIIWDSFKYLIPRCQIFEKIFPLTE